MISFIVIRKGRLLAFIRMFFIVYYIVYYRLLAFIARNLTVRKPAVCLLRSAEHQASRPV